MFTVHITNFILVNRSLHMIMMKYFFVHFVQKYTYHYTSDMNFIQLIVTNILFDSLQIHVHVNLGLKQKFVNVNKSFVLQVYLNWANSVLADIDKEVEGISSIQEGQVLCQLIDLLCPEACLLQKLQVLIQQFLFSFQI